MVSSTTKEKVVNSTTIDIDGMKCAACVKAVEKQITRQQGVISANVNLITAVALVEYESDLIKPQSLADKLTVMGFETAVRKNDPTNNEQREKILLKKQAQSKQQKQELVVGALLLVLSTIGHLHHLGFHHHSFLTNIWFHWALATIALMIPGREILLNGWQGLWQRKPNMNSLIGLGATCAYLTSCIALVQPDLGWECFFDEPVMLLGFIFLGRVLEARAKNRAIESLESLINLRPQYARLVGKDNTSQDQGIKIPASQVKPQEWIRVLAGEQFSVDGVIIAGKTTVDESLLTGESLPISKSKNDRVSAGTINQNQMVIVETTSTGADTALGQIISIVEDAQSRKAPVQKLADLVSGYFTYTVISIAIGTFLFWYFIGTNIWSEILLQLDTSKMVLSIKLAVDALVIACPCALGLATPTAIVVGTSVGAESGLLIKGADVLEQAQQVKTIVFDKTGTLTQGYLKVQEIVSVKSGVYSPTQLLTIASSLEVSSNHPLAQAILRHGKQQEVSLLTTEKLTNHLGRGVSGVITREEKESIFYLGNQQLLTENNVSINLDSKTETKLQQQQQEGKTVVFLGDESRLIGYFILSDTIRNSALNTIQKLKLKNIEVIMMSGDKSAVAQNIAEQLGIEKYYGDVTPAGKSELIQKIQQQYPDQVIAMVGDGINDAPAMAVAQFAIAMPQGAQIAIQSADIILSRNNLADLITAIDLSKLTLTKIKQNLFWALSYNLVAIPLAVGVLIPSLGFILSPATAGALMVCSSIFVVTNSLLLKRKFASKKFS